MPLISVIMPAYNVQKFIYESIQSVINQSYKNWELIIIDDGSTDKTSEIINEFQKTNKEIKYIYQSNRGQAVARNTGILNAKGEWIAFLDSDDVWLQNKLENQLSHVNDLDADVYFSGGYIIDEGGVIIEDYQTLCGYYSSYQMYKQLYNGNVIPMLSVLFKKKWLIKVGSMSEDPKLISWCEDWDYWLRMARAGASFYGIEDKLFKYRMNPNGTSHTILPMKIGECYTLFNNYDPSCFNKFEIQNVQFRFILLIRSIIPALFENKDGKSIYFFLSLIHQITGSLKYRISIILFYLFGYKSKKAVNFLLVN